MRTPAANAFFLAVFALFSERCAATPSSAVSSNLNPDVCAAKVSDACASYADLDALNARIHPFVRNLANNSDFFSYYRLNLYNKQCPFWNDENGLCGNIACAVTTVEDQNDLPKIWRAEELSKLEGPKASHPGKRQQKERSRPLLGELGDEVGESCVVEYDDECDDRDYCVPEDEAATSKGDYVSLSTNPERFTGYAGEGAHHVWDAIYRENCFSRPVKTSESAPIVSPLGRYSSNQAQAANDLQQVIKQSVQDEDGPDFLGECLEKRMFYRVISGMHASISTHLCHDYLNQTTGEWGPNLQCYKDRLHDHPDRISNLYFNYALVLRAVGKLKDYAQDYTFCTGDPKQERSTKNMISLLASVVPSGPEIFDESVMFQDQDPTIDGLSLKEDFRNRFRNVSRIMDCVGCDKCRLWGKVQTAGYGTALKVLFEFDHHRDHRHESAAPFIRRTEMVALINTLDKISSALTAIGHFRSMITAEMGNKPRPSSGLASASSVHSPKRHDEALDDDDDDDDQIDSLLDFSALDDLEEFPEPPPETLSDIFWAELSLVFRAYVFVLKSWISFPGKVTGILRFECSRLIDLWLGRPMQPRTWQIKFPSRDEL